METSGMTVSENTVVFPKCLMTKALQITDLYAFPS